MSRLKNTTQILTLSLALFSLIIDASSSNAFAANSAACILRQALAAAEQTPAAHEGHFVRASHVLHDELARQYLEAGVIKKIESHVKRVGSADLAIDLNTMTKPQLGQLLAEGRRELPKLYYFTSGAGLWSRGGGQVKALIPFNVKELLSAEEFALLVKSGDIANAAHPEDVLKLVGRVAKPGEDIEKTAEAIVAERRAILTKLIDQARRQPEAMTPIDMKLVNVALQSEVSRTYIPFDIWTSEQTHAPIQQYLTEFKASYKTKLFHSDPVIDQRIKDALGKYIAESDRLGETHLFGYHVGFHALDSTTGKPVTSSPLIGEGAGMAKTYLEQSGRAAALAKMGKNTWVFENIEVVTDLPIGMGAHARSGKPVSVILVPEKRGYKGGSPFLVQHNGKYNLELHEMSALPESFANGNEFFNSNTIFQSLALKPPKNVGFEVKNFNGKKVVRGKMNAGDITLEAPTAGIGGRIGMEYENFKNYLEFGENGNKLISTFRSTWARDVKTLLRQR